jgi:hypothetical protein
MGNGFINLSKITLYEVVAVTIISPKQLNYYLSTVGFVMSLPHNWSSVGKMAVLPLQTNGHMSQSKIKRVEEGVRCVFQPSFQHPSRPKAQHDKGGHSKSLLD